MQYRVSGKEHHLEDSETFFFRVDAESVDDALKAAIKELEFYGDDEFAEEVAEKLARVRDQFRAGVGAEVWVGDERIFDIQRIEPVEDADETCPHCRGTGRVAEYIPF